jgi:hypothetical protein
MTDHSVQCWPKFSHGQTKDDELYLKILLIFLLAVGAFSLLTFDTDLQRSDLWNLKFCMGTCVSFLFRCKAWNCKVSVSGHLNRCVIDLHYLSFVPVISYKWFAWLDMYYNCIEYKGVSRSFWTGHLVQELQMVQLSATKYSCIAILWVSLVCFATMTLCVASQWVFIVVYSLLTQSGNFWIYPCIFSACNVLS